MVLYGLEITFTRYGGQVSVTFTGYSIPFNNWSVNDRNSRQRINSGGALVYTGGNYLYALREERTHKFLPVLQIPFNNWSFHGRNSRYH